jgi:hypothetical protein
MKKPKPKHVVAAPAAVGRGAVNRINSVMPSEDEDVQWIWTSTPEGGRFVSGYTLLPRVAQPAARRRRRGA